MSEEDISLALRMCFHIYDTDILNQVQDPNELLMILAYNQFLNSQKPFYAITRTIFIYNSVWPTVEKAKGFDALNEIKDMIGVSLETLILFSYLFMARQQFFFRKFTQSELSELPDEFADKINVSNQEKVLSWISTVYNTYKEDSKINPFYLYPIINTNVKPIPDLDVVYLILSRKCLSNRITHGIYYSLVEKFSVGDKDNIFKRSFGYVFQEYIGILLKYHFSKWSVIPEIQYKYSSSKIDTVDWFLLKDDKLLLIEVKQSSVFLSSKLSGRIDEIEKDINKNIIKAYKQLKKTENSINSKKFNELSIFNNVKYFQRMIVIYDPFLNSNYMVKKILKKEYENYPFHIIDIDDFEFFLDAQKDSESLFDMLEYKLLDPEMIHLDFNEFIIKIFKNDPPEMKFLKEINEKYFSFINKYKPIESESK